MKKHIYITKKSKNDLMDKIVKFIKKAMNIYDRHEGDSGPRMFDGCNRLVNSFIREGEFDSGGRR